MASTAALDDHGLGRVPRSGRKHWFGIAVQRFGQVSALSQFLLGATLGYGMGFWDAALAFLLGSVVLEVVMCVVGIIGQREGMQTSLLLEADDADVPLHDTTAILVEDALDWMLEA